MATNIVPQLHAPQPVTVTDSWSKALSAANCKRIELQNQDDTNALSFLFLDSPWCLTFDGTDDVVAINNILSSDVKASETGRIDIVARVAAAGSGARTLFSIGDTDGSAYLMVGVDTNNKITALLADDSATQWAFTADNALEDATWYHIRLIRNRNHRPSLYVNGGSVAKTWATETDVTAWLSDIGGLVDNARIGALNYNSAGDADFFQGDIWRVDIGYGGTSPIATYKMTDGTGTTLTDTQGNADGTITSATWGEGSPGKQLAAATGRLFDKGEHHDHPLWLKGDASHGTVIVEKVPNTEDY